VSVPRYRMLQVLRYLRPSLRPRIAIA
jgi:hypothetical protein